MTAENLMAKRLEKLVRTSIALSAERDLGRLMDMIVDEACTMTDADGGTLYLTEGDPPTALRYFVMQTASLGIRSGGATGRPINIGHIPLMLAEGPNFGNVCAYAANTGQTVNIPDWRAYEGFDFTGPRKFEEETGYEARSFLVVAMRDHEEQLIGVLQLINATDPSTGKRIAFSDVDVQVIEALASQAAMAITNTRLIQDTERLFSAFAEVMATAIDERSHATAGHIKRVMDLTLALAGAVNADENGRFAGVHFTTEELEELRLAALLHDVGKVTTPVHLLEKRTKLEAIYDRMGEVKTRFDLIKSVLLAESLGAKVALLDRGAAPAEVAAVDAALTKQLQELEEELADIQAANQPAEFVPPAQAERIRAIGAKRFRLGDEERSYLTAEEIQSLAVTRGNLTSEELRQIREHAQVSAKLLSQIPFTRKLRRVPMLAAAHHEFLNGKGYPLRLSDDQIPLQARMMTIADIYDALTAADRSYKRAMEPAEALRILGRAAEAGEIDGDLLALFIRSGVYQRVRCQP